MAARAALASTRLPATRPIGLGDDGPGGDIGGKDAGFSGLVKGGKAGVNAVDFELLDGGWDEGERLERWEDLPVGLTLNLVGHFQAARSVTNADLVAVQINQLPHLDATALEESATASQLIVCFTSKGDLCGVKQVGEGEIELGRLMPLIRVRSSLRGLHVRELTSFGLAGGGQVLGGALTGHECKAQGRLSLCIPSVSQDSTRSPLLSLTAAGEHPMHATSQQVTLVPSHPTYLPPPVLQFPPSRAPRRLGSSSQRHGAVHSPTTISQILQAHKVVFAIFDSNQYSLPSNCQPSKASFPTFEGRPPSRCVVGLSAKCGVARPSRLFSSPTQLLPSAHSRSHLPHLDAVPTGPPACWLSGRRTWRPLKLVMSCRSKRTNRYLHHRQKAQLCIPVLCWEMGRSD